MIKANELRVGNIVGINTGFDIGVELCGVTSINKNGTVDLKGITFPKSSFVNNTLSEPIHLTPEILKKCGFEKNDSRDWKTRQTDFISVRENGRWVNGEPIDEIKYILYKSYAGALIEVKYLHQLQNLFYCVCGKELKINLLN